MHAENNGVISHREIPIKVTAVVSSETIQARRQ